MNSNIPIRALLLLSLILVIAYPGTSQVSRGGMPPSFLERVGDNFQKIRIPQPDVEALLREDVEFGKWGEPQRVGTSLDVSTDLLEEGTWTVLADGTSICRLELTASGAVALGVYFSEYKLAPGNRLFIYDPDHRKILGAYTESNNHPSQFFSTELIRGDRVILEFHLINPRGNDRLFISELAYHYKINGFESYDRASGFCEVNINCNPEGDEWQDEKRGIARIYLKSGGGFFWCTGTLINNTRRDRTPYFLTANHCGETATADDYLQWVFYFNHESEDCENPPSSPEPQTVTGCEVVSRYGEDGSDFKLLLLQQNVPEAYEPYFNGWDRTNNGSNTGVCIHHPAGDIKKISTYTAPLESSAWSGGPPTHWKVIWSETQNGYGVTEGGSSGAPIFSDEGYILGALTGGLAACDPGGGGPNTGPEKPDYYGKIYYSWDQNSSNVAERLKEWLDPGNTGIEQLRGINSVLTADFESSARSVLTGAGIEFTSTSSGAPDLYEWYFEGGTPAVSYDADPGRVVYDSAGMYDVTLVVTQGTDSDTLFRKDFIEVVGQVYPNPARDHTYIYMGEENVEYAKVEVYDLSGRMMFRNEIRAEGGFNQVRLDLTGFNSGIYMVRITRNQRYAMYKVMVVR